MDVFVHSLKTCRDGAILDQDDVLCDVADDREQVLYCNFVLVISMVTHSFV